MSLYLPNRLPAIDQLQGEGFDVLPLAECAYPSSCKRIVLLNLMPEKIAAETDISRMLAYSPAQVDLSFMMIKNHRHKNTPSLHLANYYHTIDELRNENFDAMIVNGAPVEVIDFNAVDYWNELTGIFDWARTHVHSTLFICWGAQAALHHFYGLSKYSLSEKLFGVFEHRNLSPHHLLMQGLDDTFFLIHSRHSMIRRDDLLQTRQLLPLAESEEAGIAILASVDNKEFYITGHPEYASMRLDTEYHRDLNKGLPIHIPCNYYPSDDPQQLPLVRWRSTAALIATNWLRYFV